MEGDKLDALYGMPGHLIRRVQQIHSAIFAEECAKFGLTSVQFAALTAIAANAGVDATRLSALIAFDRSTLGDVLTRVEAKQWIVRKPCPSDKRIKLLWITEQGADLLRQVEPVIGQVQHRLLAPLRPKDRSVFVRLLAAIADVHNDLVSAPLRPEAGRRDLQNEVSGIQTG